MPVLPQTARGAWALATMCWLAGCAALWWALPVRSRTVIRLSDEHHLIGFGPGGRMLVTCGTPLPLFAAGGLPAPEWNGPVQVWDAHTGELLSTVLPRDTRVVEAKTSPDGRWLAVTDVTDDYLLKLFDLATLRLAAALPCDTIGPGAHYALFSSDARKLCFAKPGVGTTGLSVWDLECGCERPRRVRWFVYEFLKD